MSHANRPSFMPGGQFAPSRPGSNAPVANPRQAAYEGRVNAMNKANEDAANALRSMLVSGGAAEIGSPSPLPMSCAHVCRTLSFIYES